MSKSVENAMKSFGLQSDNVQNIVSNEPYEAVNW